MARVEVVEEVAAPAQQRLALLLSVVLLATVALIVPVASVRWPALPHVAGIYGAAIAMIALATFWLLSSAPNQTRSHAIIAAAYLYAGLMALLHVLTFPGAVVPGPVIGSPHAVSLLFIAWRAGFAAFIVWAAVAAGDESPDDRPPGPVPNLVALAAVATAFGVSQLSDAAALANVGGRELFAAVSVYGAFASVLLAAVGMALIWRRRLYRRSLFVWLAFVLIAEAAGVWLSTFSGGRYTLAWYTTRFEGVIANAVVLLVLGRHFRSVQANLARTVDSLQARTEALQSEIHHRERVEAQLAQAQKLEAVGRLGAGLAHDLNNILQVVTNRTAILRRRIGDAADPDADIIRRNVRKAEALTRQLTLLSGRRSVHATPLDVEAKLDEIVDSIRPLLGEGQTLQLDVQRPLPRVAVDPLELEIAVTNLASNARDAMPDGGLLVIAAFRGPDGAVAVQVRDGGIGMRPELLERVFEPFFTTKAPGKGTGLGLAQVYGFVTASGGRVVVDSTPGAGTTVTMSFPALDPADVAAAVDAPAAPAPGQVVLLVDDNDDVREATVQLLGSEGCVVRAARDGAEALALLRGGLQPDLMVSDIVMPGDMNGVELARRARALRAALRVVLVTGYSDAAQAARDEGFPVVAKPYDLAALRRALGS